jgi:Mg-chelatase subunit ChlD
MLADLTSATDPRLRQLARRLAGRVVVDVARIGAMRKRGIGRIVRRPYEPDAGDLDVDASIEPLVEARAGLGLDVERLRVRSWSRPETAVCLLVDRSGSMSGGPLAANALAAAAVALRAPQAWGVLAFANRVVVVKSLADERRPIADVVDRVLALRGHGTTDVAAALNEASRQLCSVSAGRRIAILLSDCRANEPGDVVAAAASLDELVVIAPVSDDAEAREMASAVGARVATVSGPSDIPTALNTLLDPA